MRATGKGLSGIVAVGLILLAGTAAQAQSTIAPSPIQVQYVEKLLYVRPLPSGNNAVFSSNLDGANEVQLSPGWVDCRYPAWSPDGTRIAYSARRVAGTLALPGCSATCYGWHIFVADVNNHPTDPNYILALTYKDCATFPIDPVYVLHNNHNCHPSWSWDGTRIAYQWNKNENENYLAIANVTLGGSSTATRYGMYGLDPGPWSGWMSMEPTWSPDGRTLAFTAGQYVRTVDVATGYTVPILASGMSPAWSANGSAMAYEVWFSQYDHRLYWKSLTSPTSTCLGSGDDPVWTWQGKVIYGSNGALYMVNTDGTSRRFLRYGQYPDLFTRMVLVR